MTKLSREGDTGEKKSFLEEIILELTLGIGARICLMILGRAV